MTKAEDIFKVFEWANFITMNKNGDIYIWKHRPVIDEDGGVWLAGKRLGICNALRSIQLEEFKNCNWKYGIIERPFDYNLCKDKLGWFSNGDEIPSVGILTAYFEGTSEPFRDDREQRFIYFTPMKYDSDLFYKGEDDD